MSYTREQNLAINSDIHLVVTANAGSGKTRTLVERYLRILKQNGTNIRNKNIVAITFTRKAAAEMLKKIAVRLEEELQNTSDYEQLKVLSRHRRDLINARITTIHSFCSSLLREYPIEANLPVNFTEIDEIEKNRLIKLSIFAALENCLDKNDEKAVELEKLIQLFGFNSFNEQLTTLLNNTELLHSLEKIYNNDNYIEIITKQAIVEIAKFLDYRFKFVYENIFSPILRGNFNNYKTEKYAELFTIVEQFVNEYEKIRTQLTQTSHFDDFISFCNTILPVIKLFYKPFEDLRKINPYTAAFGKNYKQDQNKIYEETDYIRSSMKELIECIEDDVHNEYSIRMLEYNKLFFEIASDANKLIREEKEENAWIDFNDMIILSRDILQIEEVRNAVSESMLHLLIDEFQDTNNIQYEIVKSIVTDLDAGKNSEIKLYIVGDAKQSIYRFRSADVRVFIQAQKDIINANKNNIVLKEHFHDEQNSIKENYGEINLSTTFRLSPLVASFVNYISSRMFLVQKEFNEFDIPYNPLIYGRNVRNFLNEISNINDNETELNHNFGSITILATEKENSRKRITQNFDDENNNLDTNNFFTEADTIAETVWDIINKKAQQYRVNILEDNMPNGRLPKYSDIAILARKRSGFKQLTEAFIKKGIPFSLIGGTGFYDSQEIIDIISFLKYITNPNDNLALASILKSPFFNFDEIKILNLAKHNERKSFNDNLYEITNLMNIEDEDNYLYKRATKILSDLLMHSTKLSISSLIRKIIDDTSWEAAIINMPGAIKMKANITKMIEIAEKFERVGNRNLFDFVEELSEFEEVSSESDAEFEVDDNSVKIMTIHASKGLEFPIVFLYDINSKAGSSEWFFIDEKFGIISKYYTFYKNTNTTLKFNNSLYYVAKTRNKFAEEAEDKRLIYVAMTRAKDHLLISTTFQEGSNGQCLGFDGLFKIMSNALNYDATKEKWKESEFVNYIPSVQTDFNWTDLFIKSEDVYFVKKIQDTLHYINKDSNLKLLNINYGINFIVKKLSMSTSEIEYSNSNLNNLNNQTELKINKPLLKTKISDSTDRYFSASGLATFSTDKYNYVNKYILGLPDIQDSPLLISNSIDKPEQITGTFVGSLIHIMLENVNHWLSEDFIIRSEIFDELLDFNLHSLSRMQQENIKVRLYNECNAIINTDLFKSYYRYISKGKFEHILALPINNDFLYAQIDLLLIKDDNNYEIWDWKSNNIQSIENIAELANMYSQQMEFYAYMVSQFNKTPSSITARLLFTRLAEKSKNEKDWTYTFNFNQQKMKEIEERIYTQISEMKKYML